MYGAVDLSTIAMDLDEQERQRMAELGTHTQEYKDFVQVRDYYNYINNNNECRW
jgi:hypothetical protein